MIVFRLVAEGATDFYVFGALEECIRKCTGEDVEITRLHPQEYDDVSGRPRDEQGWMGVLRYIGSETFARVVRDLADDEYIIVQIDSDIAESPALGVDRTLPTEKLVESLALRLRERCGHLDESLVRSRIIFAVCVHCIECWLLPFFFEPPVSEKTQGCIRKLNEVLRHQHDLPYIDEKNKQPDIYQKIMRYARSKRKKQFTKGNKSLEIFLEAVRSKRQAKCGEP